MTKQKYFFITFLFICFVSLLAVIYLLKNKYEDNKIIRRDNTSDTSPSSVLSNNTGNQSMTLEVAPNSIDSDLKQLSLNSGNADKSNNNKSETPNVLDPKTFIQYEKYKSEQSALFGEIQVGTGEELTNNKKAVVVYKVWLTDGTLVDMSRTDESGKVQPFIFTMGAHQVILGWEQAMTGMKAGGSRLLIVPPSAGYGATAKENIPANSVLVFFVQLVSVQ